MGGCRDLVVCRAKERGAVRMKSLLWSFGGKDDVEEIKRRRFVIERREQRRVAVATGVRWR